jgi:hypothetical protein
LPPPPPLLLFLLPPPHPAAVRASPAAATRSSPILKRFVTLPPIPGCRAVPRRDGLGAAHCRAQVSGQRPELSTFESKDEAGYSSFRAEVAELSMGEPHGSPMSPLILEGVATRGEPRRERGLAEAASGVIDRRGLLWLRAEVAELADAPDSKSGGAHAPCGFDSHLRHSKPGELVPLERLSSRSPIPD